MKYLVTGGAGFIGSNIVEELLRRGQEVRVLDNFSTGKRQNIEKIQERIELIEGNICSYHIVRRAAVGVDVILHQAALPSVPRSIADPITSNEVNVDGTLNVLNAAKECGVKRIVFASSSSVYGNATELPKHEGLNSNPMSPYAVSKLAGEKYCEVFSRLYGLETIALRYFNVFGPRQDPDSQYSAVIPRFITKMLHDEQPVIYGDGKTSRDFTFISNVVNVNLLAADSKIEPGSCFNCACDREISLNDLVATINVVLGKKISPIYAAARPGDIKHSRGSIDQLRRKLHFLPTNNFEDEISLTVEWFQKKHLR
ncbi:MAG TPA: SDR family oxidoreductase [Candidatus Acidoferrales bacterium]|nr:SDR family oxidoreductase [Candidatus Acidoferrales bacterium]